MRKVEWDYPIPSYFLFAMVMIMEYTPKIVVVIGKMMTVFRLWWLNIVMENCTFNYDLPIPDFRWYILSPWWWPLYGEKDIDSVKTRTWLGRNKSDDDVPSFVHLSWPMTFCNLLKNICFPVARQKQSIKLNESQHVQRCFSGAKTPWGCGASWQKIDGRWEFQQAVAVAVPSDIQTLQLTNPRLSPNTPAGWWF